MHLGICALQSATFRVRQGMPGYDLVSISRREWFCKYTPYIICVALIDCL